MYTTGNSVTESIQTSIQSEATCSFGYWVRRRRLALDMTQSDLARAVPCARVTIAKIECDERRPSRQLASILADCLAVPPDQRDRFLAIARGELSALHIPPADEPLQPRAPAYKRRPPSNLGAAPTPFVGRQAELDQLRSRLQEPTCQMLTLLGPGGFGKTRLATRLGELALELPDLFPDGVYLAALDALESSHLVVPAIAAAIDFTFHDRQPQEHQLLAYLADKHMLLLLDNAEDILDRNLVERILQRAPGVKTVVTTRVALQLQQEWLYPVGGMSLDEAPTLFEHCAQRAHPHFDPARERIHAEQICRIVDGAPLAIELAAAWLKALPCEHVLEELTRSIDLLATSVHNSSPRHRSMRAVLEQSWRYLTGEEQRVMHQLAMIEGSFGLPAAQAVGGASPHVLAGLVDKSMLQLGGDGRYRIHALLRQHGAQQLAEHQVELAECRARHCRYYLSFASARTAAIVGPDQVAALRELQDELENIRAAWQYATQCGQVTQLRDALPCLFRFLWMRNRYEEGDRLAMQALAELAGPVLSVEERSLLVGLLAHRAMFAATVGAYDNALAWSHAALEDAERLDIPLERGHCHYVAGLTAVDLGNADRAIRHLTAAYQLYHVLHDNLGIAEAAVRLSQTYYSLKSQYGRPADELAVEAVKLYRALGDRFGLCDALNSIAYLRWMGGMPDEAEKLYQESFATATAVGNQAMAASARSGLALMAKVRGQWDLAISLQQDELATMLRLGFDIEIKHKLNFLCGTYAAAGRYAEAMALLDTYPDMWRTPWTAQAQVGAGAYAAAMAYLPQETADKLVIDHAYDMSLYLVAWAMLLASDCELQRADSVLAPRIMLREEREALACEILLAVQNAEPRDPARDIQANRLLAGLWAETGGATADQSPAVRQVRSIRELAREMAAIRQR
ncbi:MAG: NB-ARC domain-containing protein [Caldilineaceae bacterium]